MKESFFFDYSTKKAYVLVLSIFWGLVLIGSLMESAEDSSPVIREPWFRSTKSDLELAEKRKLRSAKKTVRFNRSKEVWSDDRKEQTENWADFLEELDNRGYTVYDAEAEDIWDQFK
ncbi:MAG: hypothetical protein PF484_02665 [Bacteroidales bacterium]|jgi:hypothetical protein|nr:hypothetical protein [Bacteroidales bacterium]